MPSRAITEILGHLGRDPETRHTPNGSPVTSFSVAVSHDYKNKSGQWVNVDPQWYSCQIWGSLGERFAERFQKGSLVMLRGKEKVRTWETKTGETRVDLELKVFEVYDPLVDSKDESSTPIAKKNSRQESDFPVQVSESSISDDEDIPF